MGIVKLPPYGVPPQFPLLLLLLDNDDDQASIFTCSMVAGCGSRLKVAPPTSLAPPAYPELCLLLGARSAPRLFLGRVYGVPGMGWGASWQLETWIP